MIYYTYKLIHVKTGQFYFGHRRTKKENPYDDLGIRYKSSSKYVKDLGFENFSFGVVKTYPTYDECYWDEQRLIKDGIQNPLCLNKSYFDKETGSQKFSTFGIKMSDKFREKCRNRMKNFKHTDESRKKISLSHLGKTQIITEETKKKMSIAALGKKKKISHKQSISKGLIGHPVSDETKKKIGDANRGRVWSEETRRKILESRKRFYATRQS